MPPKIIDKLENAQHAPGENFQAPGDALPAPTAAEKRALTRRLNKAVKESQEQAEAAQVEGS